MAGVINGLKLTDGDVLASVAKMRQVLEPLFYQEVDQAKRLVTKAILRNHRMHWIDDFKLNDHQSDLEPILNTDRRRREFRFFVAHSREQLHKSSLIHNIVFEKAAELQKRRVRTSPLDFLYRVNIFPNGVQGENPLVVVSSSLVSQYKEALLDSGIVESYSYEPSSWEHPEEVLQQRQEEWSNVIGLRSGRYSDSGLVLLSPSSEKTILSATSYQSS